MGTRWAKLLLTGAAIGAAHGQAPPGWRKSLQRIEAAARPHCQHHDASACAAVEFAQKLENGLEGKWARSEEQRRNPLPRAYLESLNALASELETLSRAAGAGTLLDESRSAARGPTLKTSAETRLQEAFARASRDLEAKYVDCRAFGMGRIIPVSVRAIGPDHQPQTGWEVYYTCTLGGQTGTEIRAPGLTTATVELPPSALCAFRVSKGGQQARAGQVPVFGRQTAAVDILVP